MYSGGSVVGKASTIGIEISPTPPLILVRCQKCEIWRLLSTSVKFEPPAVENAARYPNTETNYLCKNDRHDKYVLAKFGELGPRISENRWAEIPRPYNCTAKTSITSSSSSSLSSVHGLNARWSPMHSSQHVDPEPFW